VMRELDAVSDDDVMGELAQAVLVSGSAASPY